MNSLFSAEVTREHRKRGFSEPVYDYLSTSPRPSFSRLRDQWNKWFEFYPVEMRPSLAGRFRSASEHQHLSAAVELFTFGVVLEGGFQVVVDPPIGNYLLDFEAHRERDNFRFYVECTVTGQDAALLSADALEAEFLDAIDKTPVARHMLGMDIEARGTKAPPARKLRNDLAQWIASTAPGEEGEYRWSFEGWRVTFHAIPIREDAEDAESAIGMTLETDVVDEAPRINKALDVKASKYGGLDAPLVVVLGSTEMQRDDDLWDALLGSRVWTVNHLTHDVTESRKPDGVLLGSKGPRNTAMSAVMHSAFRSHSFASADNQITITHHPRAALPLPRGLFPFAEERWFDIKGKLVRDAPQCTVAEYFGLAEGWPHFSDDPPILS